ncbi:MAG: aminotransferase class III-fold pyridoxal phosphate-dependent enzyme [Xanthomonadales bacterium]|nr:aminotransferase class III-fold pyridoxal phosphate-dependent enzyme [Xanthomonadales bacterium]
MKTDSLKLAIEDSRARYVAANPRSMAADKNAEQFLPGGNTRSVLHYDPFPLTMVRGEGAELLDLDGHRYADFLCEYSAGLFGHSDKIIRAAVHEAIDRGVVMGAPTHYERELAGLLCTRFPSIEKIRFCNSGTESNLMAITTARTVTGRDKIIVFDGAYHGGVIKFPNGNSRHNVPYDFVLSEYNDVEGTAELIHQLGSELAAVMVEPILGAGGNIPGTREFLEMLRKETLEVGALLIFDEVKTARIGPAGIQGLMGIKPDLTTLGKFIGGGLPTGAFGGNAEIMEHYNPKKKGTWNHAGTFNNNVCSMAAGAAGIGEIYTHQRALDFLDWSEAFRVALNDMFIERDMPMHCNGLGSIFAIHFSLGPVKKKTDISAGCLSLRPLLHMELLHEGVLVAGRGDVFQSLPMTQKHLFRVSRALERFIDRHKPLVLEVLGV